MKKLLSLLLLTFTLGLFVPGVDAAPATGPGSTLIKSAGHANKHKKKKKHQRKASHKKSSPSAATAPK
jgi:hypothetical protein